MGHIIDFKESAFDVYFVMTILMREFTKVFVYLFCYLRILAEISTGSKRPGSKGGGAMVLII